MMVIDRLIQSLRDATRHNPEVQDAPACILWPDKDRQWEPVITRLQAEMPELFVLGDYDPSRRKGPAIWLRCAIARKIEDLELPRNMTPIIYLPGFGRQDLRAVESCKDLLRPMAELQYSGTVWTQLNTRDWTIFAFLKSDQGGLGLDVARDNGTKNAMQLALDRLLDEEIDNLKGKRLDKDYFNALLTGDPVRDLLQWLDQGDGFREGRADNEWQAFVEICKSHQNFNPKEDGILAGAELLAAHEGAWRPVWDRFCEAPKRYPNIPATIRRCKPPKDKNIYWHTGGSSVEGWPQWNDEQENKLRKDLDLLDSAPPHIARENIEEIERLHGSRRELIWAELGEAPLAKALEHLSLLAEITKDSLAAGSVEDLASGYRVRCWQADDSLLRALASVKYPEDFEAVKTAIRAVYLPWSEDSARYLQKVVDDSGYPGSRDYNHEEPRYPEGECVLFVDGLRFDAAKRLEELLTNRGYRVEEKPFWAPLPTVTATGKPAASPVRSRISGTDTNTDFEPCVEESGQSLKGGHHLKRLLEEAGWEVLDRSSKGKGEGKGKGNAWCEFGNIDREGHDRGRRLASNLDDMLEEIGDLGMRLLEAGWKRVRITTDHGWLLMPGGLPKVELPTALTDIKWGRCAAIKPGALTDERLYPWYWNPNQHFALADGISCFRNGLEYDHGGLSLQECFLLELTVSAGSSPASGPPLEITDVVWRGLRCNVAVDGDISDLRLDIRTKPGNSSSSVVMSVKQLNEDKKTSVVVEEEELEGTRATVVLLDSNGSLVAQSDTVIGGG